MPFTLIEQLNGFTSEVDTIAYILSESFNEADQLLYETADGVLDSLYTTLKSGGRMHEKEAEDYAEIVAGLSMLTIDHKRQEMHVNISEPEGQQKFMNILDHVGEHNGVTLQVRRIARDAEGSQYRSYYNKFRNFSHESPSKQQDVLTDINKLRLAYQKIRQQISDGEFKKKD